MFSPKEYGAPGSFQSIPFDAIRALLQQEMDAALFDEFNKHVQVIWHDSVDAGTVICCGQFFGCMQLEHISSAFRMHRGHTRLGTTCTSADPFQYTQSDSQKKRFEKRNISVLSPLRMV